MKRPLLPADPKLRAHLQAEYARRMRQANRLCGVVGLVLLLWLLGMSLESCRSAYRPRRNAPSWQATERRLEVERPRQ